MHEAGLSEIRTLADYQFGAGVGETLFPADDDYDVERSKTGRPRQIATTATGERRRLVSLGTDGRFTLGLAGGERLVDALDAPRGRVVVGDESEPYVREGRNVFAKFVQAVDPTVRASDEVAVVHADGDVLAVGRAELDAAAMRDFDTGMAVLVREGDDPA